jgi:pimeloyl-ACP methyl ester carboxylesterase
MECRLEDITLYYEVVGEGRPIIMLHGWPLDHRHMMSELEPLFQHRDGWKRVYPDLPGMGRTPGKDWITHQDQMLDVALDFIDSVIPGQRFVVAGASYGGYLARGVVHERSDLMDGLLLTVPVIHADESERTLPPAVTLLEDPALISELPSTQADAVQGIAVVQSRELLEWLRANVFPAIEAADQAFLSKVRKNYAFSFDVDVLPEPFAGPTLILMGRQDGVCGYCDAWGIMEDYPRATFAVLDRAGHGLAVEQRCLFNALVGDWLERVEEYAMGCVGRRRSST